MMSSALSQMGEPSGMMDENGEPGVTELHKPRSGKSPNALEYLSQRKIDLVINDPENGDKETPVWLGATQDAPGYRTLLERVVALEERVTALEGA